MKIPVYKPTITQAEKNYVNECLETEWVSSKGSFIGRFERTFADYIKSDYALTVSNGTTALHVALLALGIGPEDEVIVPTLTYVAAANAVTYAGACPAFVDSSPTTWQMDPDDVRKSITSKTRAILAVHIYGQPCDMDALSKIASDHNLLLIEDCAEALGSYVGDRHVGTFGDVSTFSFYGNKTITTGEGGMVVTNDPNLSERISHLKGQGLAKSREYWHDIIGYNYRMTNICAALGCAQLERIDSILERKREIAMMYRRELNDLVEFQELSEGTTHSHWMVCFLVDRANQRDAMRESLARKGIETRPVFYPVHSMPMYSHLYRRMPISVDVGSRGINLPSFPELTNDEVLYVCDAVKQHLAQS